MIELFNVILMALQGLIFVDVLLSWLIPPDRFPRTLTKQLTDPLYAPIRVILNPERMGGLDLAPMVLLLIIFVMKRMLERAVGGGF